VKKPPETWFWSHDIKPTQIDAVIVSGTRLMRLSSYGQGTARRFAALLHMDGGPERSYALDLDAAALAGRLRDTGARAVSITATVGNDGVPRFSVLLESAPGAVSSVHVDLDAAGVSGLVDDGHCIADIATYAVGGARRFAAIVEERTGPSWVFTGTTPAELDAQLLALDATLVRLRAYFDGPVLRLAAVAERARVGTWAWYADLDADGVARNLEGNSAYPVDLDAMRDLEGVRYAVVMYRQR
jgi:hypothetical protein